MRKDAPPGSETPCLMGRETAGPIAPAPHRGYSAAIIAL